MANPQCEEGHLDLANEIVEKLALQHLTPNEWRFVFALWRKTYCWHKKNEYYNTKEWMRLTNLSKYTLSEVKSSLIDKKIVTENGNKIGFNKDWSLWKNKLPKTVTVTKNGNTVTKNGKNNRLLKETILKENIYSERTLRICNDLKIKPTETLEEYISVIYKQYSFKQLVDVLKQWCFENNKKPSGLRLMNWIKRAVEKGELPLWEGEK